MNFKQDIYNIKAPKLLWENFENYKFKFGNS